MRLRPRMRHGAVRWHRKHPRVSAHQRQDPSRTNGVLRQYTADLNRRWRRVQRLITETVVVNDALRLAGSGISLPVAAARAATPFQFRSDPGGKVEDFDAWLDDMMDDVVLSVTRGPRGRIGSNARWQSVYVRASYSKGLQHAKRELTKAKIPFSDDVVATVFNAPVHAESLALLYGRQFNELEGITRATSQRLGRVLTNGLAQGHGPEAIAREMRSQVKNIGMVRSRALARTEIINSHATATLNRYADAGVEGVTVRAEFLTAGDDLVCPICDSLQTGESIPLDEARGIIPVHTNCRCVWLPALPVAIAA